MGALAALAGCGDDSGSGGGDNAAPKTTLLISHQGRSKNYGAIIYGDTATMRVRTLGAPVGEVHLEASPYPFRAYKRVASAKPTSGGLVKFKVRPERNTRYRAVAGDVRSSQDTVIVILRGHFHFVPAPHGGIQVFLTGTGPRGLEARKGTEVFFYIRRPGSRTYRRFGRREPYVLRSNAIRAGGDFDIRSTGGDRVFICPVDGGMAVGLGFEKSPVRGCGDKTLPDE